MLAFSQSVFDVLFVGLWNLSVEGWLSVGGMRVIPTPPPPGGHLIMSGDVFSHDCWGKDLLLASRKWRLGTLLNMVKCTGQPLRTKIFTSKCQEC